MRTHRPVGAAPALAVLAVVTTVLALAACGLGTDGSSDPCTAYCATVTAHCTGDQAQFSDAATCAAYCARARTTPEFWSLGTTGDASGNSVACRTYHAGAPALANAAQHCPHAGASGADVCGTWCGVYCDLALSACTGTNQLYADRAACTTACAGLATTGAPSASTGDTVQCRITHLGLAAAGPQAALDHCPHGAAAPTAPCTNN